MVNVRIHKNAAGLVESLSTNANDELEFLSAVTDELQHDLQRQLMPEAIPGYPREPTIEALAAGTALFGITLSRALPLVVEVCCKLRGYKADVAEHRIIVAGRTLPADVVGAMPEYADEAP